MSKKWVAVLPCGNETLPTIAVLKQKGYAVAGIDQNAEAPAFKSCDKAITAPLDDYEQILYTLKAESIEPEAFLPIVSDKAVLPAYTLNRLFGHTKINKNVLAFYSKSIFRQTLKKNRLPVPKFHVVSDKEQLPLLKRTRKIILKPDDSSGSRGITIIESPDRKKLERAFEFALGFSSNKKVIIEEYIKGEEFMIDCFIHQQKVSALLVSQKEKIADKVSSLIYTLNKTEFPYGKLKLFIERLVKSLAYEYGPMHIELKYDGKKFYILDLAVRGGGFGVYNYYVHKALGFSFVKATIEVFLKKKLKEKLHKQREGLIYFLTPEKTGVLNEITCTYKPIKGEDVRIDYYYKHGQKLTMDVTDGNRLAGIYCFADTKEQLKVLFAKVKNSIQIHYDHER